MEALLRWYYTVRPLKAVQWWYLLARRIGLRLSRKHKAKAKDVAAALAQPAIQLESLIVNSSYDPGKREFTFLNRSKAFEGEIDWDWQGEGLLWAYNLNYFEWLYDDTLSIANRLATIEAFTRSRQHKIADHAYPISLRSVAWIRFFVRFEVKDQAIIERLYSDVDWLCRFPEYHLQGNHLFENAMSLLCAGLYFRNERFYAKGERLIKVCIEEQVLADGGHIEGSPMYHSLLLWRLVQCVELIRALSHEEDALVKALLSTTSKMLGWLQAMTFGDGSWPMFNDCAAGIAPSTAELTDYATQLGITQAPIKLCESGYRMIRWGDFELAIDAAPVQPPYQPGHTHADIGTFCLHYKGQPVIVDTGTSTYEESERRMHERGTAAHNTLVINDENSSEVWRVFRVGRRSRRICVQETLDSVTLTYSPYAYPDISHFRIFSWNDYSVTIADKLEGRGSGAIEAFLHFHPGIKLMQMDRHSFSTNSLQIRVESSNFFEAYTYQYALGFNRLTPAEGVHLRPIGHLIIEITQITRNKENVHL